MGKFNRWRRRRIRRRNEEKEVIDREREGGEQKGRRHIDFIAFACTGSYRLGPWASRAYDSLPNDPNKSGKRSGRTQGCRFVEIDSRFLDLDL